MTEQTNSQGNKVVVIPFYDRPNVKKFEIPVGPGIPFGIEQISNPGVGIGGAYGAWGISYDNTTLFDLIEESLGSPLNDKEKMNRPDRVK